MFAAPAEGTLKDFMEFAETGFAGHEQSPPNQRTHATEHYAELINRNRRYGRFRHASSLPKPTRTPSNLTPPESPALLLYKPTATFLVISYRKPFEVTMRPLLVHRFHRCRYHQQSIHPRPTANTIAHTVIVRAASPQFPDKPLGLLA